MYFRHHSWRVILSFSLVLFVNSCHKKEEGREESPKEAVQTAIETHAAALSYDDWSDSYKKIFSNAATMSESEKLELCMELRDLEIKDLALFYEEITLDANIKLIPCLADLVPLLKDFYKSEEKRLNTYIQDQKKSPSPTPVPGEKKPDFKKNDATQVLPGSNSFGGSLTLEKILGYPVYDPAKDYRKEYLVNAGLIRSDRGCEIALTFDDGPNGSATPGLMDVLDQYNVKATFFMTGENISTHEEIVERMIRDHHKIGTHSWDHSNLTKKSFQSAVESQIEKSHQALVSVYERYTGHELRDRFFRFPYGAMTKDLNGYLVKEGFFNFFWSIDSLDWKYKNDSVRLYQHLMSGLNSNKGGIVLFHDIHKVGHIIIPKFLEELADRKCKTVVFSAENLDS